MVDFFPNYLALNKRCILQSPILMVSFLPFHRMTCKSEFLIITPWKEFTCLKHIQITFAVLLCIPHSLSYWQAAVRVLWNTLPFIKQLFLGSCFLCDEGLHVFTFFCWKANLWASSQHDSGQLHVTTLPDAVMISQQNISSTSNLNTIVYVLLREHWMTLLLNICQKKGLFLAVIWEFAPPKFYVLKKIAELSECVLSWQFDLKQYNFHLFSQNPAEFSVIWGHLCYSGLEEHTIPAHHAQEHLRHAT